MAKSPSAKVSKTSGQGVSRLSYQKGYALGNKGTGSGQSASVKSEKLESKPTRSGGGKGRIDSASGMNVSYGDTIFPTDLKEIEKFGKGKPPKSEGFLKLGKKHSYKAGKDDSGFLKGKK